MREHELPERWRVRVAEHAERLSHGRYKSLGASAFRDQSVRLRFTDGTNAVFHWAFYLKDEETQEIAVFTEHCGYHVFPLFDTIVDVLETPKDDG